MLEMTSGAYCYDVTALRRAGSGCQRVCMPRNWYCAMQPLCVTRGLNLVGYICNTDCRRQQHTHIQPLRFPCSPQYLLQHGIQRFSSPQRRNGTPLSVSDAASARLQHTSAAQIISVQRCTGLLQGGLPDGKPGRAQRLHRAVHEQLPGRQKVPQAAHKVQMVATLQARGTRQRTMQCPEPASRCSATYPKHEPDRSIS